MTDKTRMDLELACESAYSTYIVELDKLRRAADSCMTELTVPPRENVGLDGFSAEAVVRDAQRLEVRADAVGRAAHEWNAATHKLVSYLRYLDEQGVEG